MDSQTLAVTHPRAFDRQRSAPEPAAALRMPEDRGGLPDRSVGCNPPERHNRGPLSAHRLGVSAHPAASVLMLIQLVLASHRAGSLVVCDIYF